MLIKLKNEHKVFIIANNQVAAVIPQGDPDVPAWFHNSYDDESYKEMLDYCYNLLLRSKDYNEKDIPLHELQAVMVSYTCGKCGKDFIGNDESWYRSPELQNRRDEFLKLIQQVCPTTQGFSNIFNPRNYYDWNKEGYLGEFLCDGCFKQFEESGLDIIGFLKESSDYLPSLHRFPYFVMAELDSGNEDTFTVFKSEKSAREAFLKRAAEFGVKKAPNGNYVRVDPYVRLYIREFGATEPDTEKMYLNIGYNENDCIVHISGYSKEKMAEAELCHAAKELAKTYGDDKIRGMSNQEIIEELTYQELVVSDKDGKHVVFSMYESPVNE